MLMLINDTGKENVNLFNGIDGYSQKVYYELFRF
jgi:hypothetical protein